VARIYINVWSIQEETMEAIGIVAMFLMIFVTVSRRDDE
jgi:hypothetical protein